MNQTLAFGSLELTIRHGLQPNNPHALYQYLDMANQRLEDEQNDTIKRAILNRVLRTLLDTICDTNISFQWRYLCLDNIYQPLNKVERYDHNEQQKAQTRHFKYELSLLGTYFL
ncbi:MULTISPECIES: hypothetical protein [Alteromonadaceae]|uniref:hypothetical protein n=1 Tax=Alteromonadaceae TaxID=72275 RepID=UPI001C08FA99|nr:MULTISPECIES: hypothetical protein [Aliiglaciecola]MBU2876803.1 hypothetical protein [Aliiglaciecola lipolytica]MDO6711906.1 hypothetical protein [Aliiglaciecola sp. 2_MG-2023]MDO6753120.1 hypothetical protein [Aliiglaciecola sp. 1_MG-2023]